MTTMTRRDFLKAGAALAASAGLSSVYGEAFAAGLEKLAGGLPHVLWLQAQSCSGCSISMLDTMNPDIVQVVTEVLSLVFHQTISAAQGETAMEILEKISKSSEPYIVVLEGSLPVGMPEACTIGDSTFLDLFDPIVRKAQFAIAAGSCSSYGGVPAAEGNETGAASLREYLEKKGLKTEGFLVNCPSCPVHPDSIVGTLSYLVERGYPDVDPKHLTPKMFFSRSTHDDCPRFHYFSKHLFAKSFADPEGCLFKLGCLGPLTFTECPRRQWNGGVNWCIRASAPCVGCTAPDFARKKDFPFYRKCEELGAVAYSESDRGGKKS